VGRGVGTERSWLSRYSIVITYSSNNLLRITGEVRGCILANTILLAHFLKPIRTLPRQNQTAMHERSGAGRKVGERERIGERAWQKTVERERAS